jgi:hypothetical protein
VKAPKYQSNIFQGCDIWSASNVARVLNFVLVTSKCRWDIFFNLFVYFYYGESQKRKKVIK